MNKHQKLIPVYSDVYEKLTEMKHELKQKSFNALLKLMIDDFYGLMDCEFENVEIKSIDVKF